MELTPRERVLTALLGKGEPDRVPWLEHDVQINFQLRIMGRSSFTPAELADSLGLDGFGFSYPCGVNFDFYPPMMAKKESFNGVEMVGQGLLTSNERLQDIILPDPDQPAVYKRVREWLNAYKGDYAVYARIRLGIAPTYLGMGLERFSYNLVDNPDFIHEVADLYANWTARVLEHINELDFDFYWVTDDLACNTGPLFSPRVLQEFFLPHVLKVIKAMNKPWVYHSDGNVEPFLPILLPLGFQGLHPIDPTGMDIVKTKQKYGDRICLLGNIDLRHTLTRGSLEDVKKEVMNRISQVAPGGRYIISSANSLTDYCKPQNVLAMGQYIKEYGKYPIRLE
ncbi:uroporphyrinogen decarboxylase family protein [Pelotomaculum propionicicum]|uniref:uroporphyrinogen decarboxylase family protein n=1 Tax=Pelotomaculum propionicicum TaxID=258475 RepID=UPI003B78E681